MTKGWKLESARHSLARRGIETGKKSKDYHILKGQEEFKWNVGKYITAKVQGLPDKKRKIFISSTENARPSGEGIWVEVWQVKNEAGKKVWTDNIWRPDTIKGIILNVGWAKVEEEKIKNKKLQPFALKHKDVEEGKGETYQYDVLGQFYPQGEKIGKLYQRYYKGRKAEIVWMTPDEYFEKINKGLKEKGFTHDIKEGLEKEGIKKLANAMKKGDKFAMPWLEYQKSKYYGHEGKHRVAAAKSLGIEKIPVVISNQISEGEDHLRWMKAKEKYRISD